MGIIPIPEKKARLIKIYGIFYDCGKLVRKAIYQNLISDDLIS